MIALIRFAFRTEPFHAWWLLACNVAYIVCMLTGYGSWVVGIIMLGINAGWLIGNNTHMQRLARLERKHNEELVDFANHALRNREKSLAPFTADDLAHWRTFRKP